MGRIFLRIVLSFYFIWRLSFKEDEEEDKKSGESCEVV